VVVPIVETSGKYEDGEVNEISSVLDPDRRKDIERRSVCHDLGLSVSIDDSIKPRPTLGSTSVFKGKYEIPRLSCRAPDLGGRGGGSSSMDGDSLGETGIDRVRS